MSASDTVVGVIGAVLLAAVMVGVFVYEANNAPDPDDPASSFPSQYRALGIDPYGDMDGNGVSNLNSSAPDDDMDGDGISNANDGHLEALYRFAGTIATSPTGDSALHPLALQAGVKEVRATLYYNTTLPSPIPRLTTLSFALVGADGANLAACTETSQTDTAVTCPLATMEPPAPQAANFEVSTAQVGLEQAYTVVALVSYGHLESGTTVK